MDEYTADKATTAVRVQLARQGMNQAELERRLGVSRGVVSRALAGSPLDERSKTWPAMLEALGLEIVIRPKQDGAA
jgi:transcriptional regulator with XRE-family HTH domain